MVLGNYEQMVVWLISYYNIFIWKIEEQNLAIMIRSHYCILKETNIAHCNIWIELLIKHIRFLLQPLVSCIGER